MVFAVSLAKRSAIKCCAEDKETASAKIHHKLFSYPFFLVNRIWIGVVCTDCLLLHNFTWLYWSIV